MIFEKEVEWQSSHFPIDSGIFSALATVIEAAFCK
jgi:hypothetical protein